MLTDYRPLLGHDRSPRVDCRQHRSFTSERARKRGRRSIPAHRYRSGVSARVGRQPLHPRGPRVIGSRSATGMETMNGTTKLSAHRIQVAAVACPAARSVNPRTGATGQRR